MFCWMKWVEKSERNVILNRLTICDDGLFWVGRGGDFLGILGFGVGLGHGRGVVAMMR